MRFRLAESGMLIDINRLPGLDGIQEDNGWLRIGALTRESALDHSQVVRERYPLLADTAKVIADPLVRNLATVGGNLAHADPANDHPATMLAYRAELRRRGEIGVAALEDHAEPPRPICDMEVDLTTARHTLDVDGETLDFCCAGYLHQYQERIAST